MADVYVAPLWNNGVDRLSTGRHDHFMAIVEARDGEKQFGNQWAGRAYFDGEPEWTVETERIYDAWTDAMAALNALIEPRGFKVLPSGQVYGKESEPERRGGEGK